MEHWPAQESLGAIGLKHPWYRPGWVYRDGEVSHVTCKAAWVLERGEALVEAAPSLRSLLLLGVKDEELAKLAGCSWLRGIEHLGLLLKPGAPLGELLGSPQLGALRSLDLNWTSNDPAYDPRDLPPKTLRPLLSAPLLGQLTSLRTSVSSVALLLEVVAAGRHLEQLGLRMQGGFSARDAERIGAAMDLPALRSLSIPTGVRPTNAPELRSLRVRGGSLPEGAELGGLQRLRLDHVFAPDLALTLAHAAPDLRELELGCARADQAEASWQCLVDAPLPALESLAVHNAPCGPGSLDNAARGGLFGRLRELSLTVTSPQLGAALGSSGLTSLRVWCSDPARPELGELAALQRLSLGYRFGSEGDAAIDAIFAEPRSSLQHFAMAAVQNQPSAGEAGLQVLLERAPASLGDVYLRLGKLPRKLTTRLRERFTVHDGGLKQTSPFAGLKDWTWPWLPWGPPPSEVDED